MPIKKENSLEAFLRKEYGDEKGKSYYVNLFAKACKYFEIDREKFKEEGGGFLLDDKNKALILLIMDLYMERESYYKRGPYQDEYHSVDSIIFPINSLIKRANKYSAIENTMNSMVEYKNIQNMLDSQKFVKKIVELFMVLIDDAYDRNTGFATITGKIEELITAYMGHNISGKLFEQHSNVHMYDQLGGEFYKSDKTQSYSNVVEHFVYELEQEVHTRTKKTDTCINKMRYNENYIKKGLHDLLYNEDKLKNFLKKYYRLFYDWCELKRATKNETVCYHTDSNCYFWMVRDKRNHYHNLYNLYHDILNYGYITNSECMELLSYESKIVKNSIFYPCAKDCTLKMYKYCHMMTACEIIIPYLFNVKLKYDCIQFNISLLNIEIRFEPDMTENEVVKMIMEYVNKACKLILEMNEDAKKQYKQYEERIYNSGTYSKINQAFGNYIYDNFTKVKSEQTAKGKNEQDRK